MANRKILGNAVLLKMDGTLIGAQRNASLDINASEIDTSDKTTGGWDTFLVGNRSWDMTCEAIAVEGDEIQDSIIDKALEGETVQIVFEHGTRTAYTGTAAISSCSLSGDKGDVSTASFNLKGASELFKSILPDLVSTVLDSTNKILTLTFSCSVVNNFESLTELKSAITFAADGVNYAVLDTKDSVTIEGSILTVTFDTAVTGSKNRVKIAAGALKAANGIVPSSEKITPAFKAAELQED